MTTMIHKEAIKIQFDYFGISRSAIISKELQGDQLYYVCFLVGSDEAVTISNYNVNGISLWLDSGLDKLTPLSQILGQAIENQFQ